MSLTEVNDEREYIIKSIDVQAEKDLVQLFELGLIEGEKISRSFEIKTGKKIVIFKVSGDTYAVNKKVSDLITVEES